MDEIISGRHSPSFFFALNNLGGLTSLLVVSLLQLVLEVQEQLISTRTKDAHLIYFPR